MSDIHYFQRYSQPENVITNNTLLLFKRLNDYSPKLFQVFINDLLTDKVPDLEVGIQFSQQRKVAAGGIPDGFLRQASFSIVIETKRNDSFNKEQLLRHVKIFKQEDRKILLLLCPYEPTEPVQNAIIQTLKQYQLENEFTFETIFTTFETIITKFKGCLSNRDYELEELIEDYSEFCSESGMLSNFKYLMRVRTAGFSLEENFACNLYYELRKDGYTKSNYFGLYARKAVIGIGRVSNIINADVDNGSFVKLESEIGKVPSKEEERRILDAIPLARANGGYQIEKGHRFYLVEKFFPTKFKKITLYPIQKSKYFDLRAELGKSELPDDVSEIATLLERKTW